MLKETVYLVDGTSLCYRAFFAINLSTSKGLPTGAIYGFYQTLNKLLSQYSPQYIGIFFDVSRKTFRQERYKEYKIQRPPVPDALKMQMSLIKELTKLMGVTLIEKEGFEAEDLIASVTGGAACDRKEVVIVSSDKDIYQLIDNNKVVTYNPHQERVINENDFLKSWGFAPKQIIDYLALMGDSVDNIPGAKGIGKVGASKLIKEFGNIENIFNNLNKCSPRLQKILSQNKDMIFLSKELVTLKPSGADVSWQDLRRQPPRYEELATLFQKLEFKKLLKTIPSQPFTAEITVREGLPQHFWDSLREAVIFITDKKGFIYDSNNSCVYCDERVHFKRLLEDSTIKKISYDFQKQILDIVDVAFKGAWFDVKVAGYLLDPSLAEYTLSGLRAHYLGDSGSHIPEHAYPYFIYQLYECLSAKLKEEKLSRLFFEVEMPLIMVLVAMQQEGIAIDREVMNKLLSQVERELGTLRSGIFKWAGREFNLNSPQQLGTVLFEELKIPPLKKTKTGYSTAEEVLEKLAVHYPIAKQLLEYRQLNKLKSTYIIPLLEEVRARKGKLHAHFNQTTTQTGRLSCSSPNLQSIPIKGKFASFLRRAFISSFDDGYILSCDYSQIELRILAHYSHDARLREAFSHNRDIHRYTASLLFDIGEADITPAQRDIAKRVNFGILYGMSPYGLARELHISPQNAEGFISDYFLRYPGVQEYINRIYKMAEEQGFVKTILGRKRYLPDIKSHNPALREFAHRQAINTPIQGSCADLIKLAMVRIDATFREKNLKTKIIMQIHDELVFDVPGNELSQVSEIVKQHMEGSIEFSVPVKVNIKYGKNWGDLKEIT